MTLTIESDVTIQMKALCLYCHILLFVFQILQNEICKLGRNLPLATFSSERVNKVCFLCLGEEPEETDGPDGPDGLEATDGPDETDAPELSEEPREMDEMPGLP